MAAKWKCLTLIQCHRFKRQVKARRYRPLCITKVKNTNHNERIKKVVLIECSKSINCSNLQFDFMQELDLQHFRESEVFAKGAKMHAVTCNMSQNLARSRTSLIGDFACISTTVWDGGTLYHHHSHAAFEGHIISVRAEDFFVIFIPVDNHGLWSSNTSLNLQQLALSILKGFWRLFGEAWWNLLF